MRGYPEDLSSFLLAPTFFLGRALLHLFLPFPCLPPSLSPTLSLPPPAPRRSQHDHVAVECTHADVQDPARELCALLEVCGLQGFDLFSKSGERNVGGLGRLLDGSEGDLHGRKRKSRRWFGGKRRRWRVGGEKEGRGGGGEKEERGGSSCS